MYVCEYLLTSYGKKIVSRVSKPDFGLVNRVSKPDFKIRVWKTHLLSRFWKTDLLSRVWKPDLLSMLIMFEPDYSHFVLYQIES